MGRVALAALGLMDTVLNMVAAVAVEPREPAEAQSTEDMAVVRYSVQVAAGPVVWEPDLEVVEALGGTTKLPPHNQAV